MSHKSNKSAKAAVQRAVGAEKEKSNKHITKISATSTKTEAKTDVKTDKKAVSAAKTADRPATAVTAKNSGKAPEKVLNAKSSKKTAKKSTKKDRKSDTEKPLKEVFILVRPFVAFGRYIRNSWREIRRVRWPNRKSTWKMTGAVLAYCVVFMVFIVLLDSFFTWLFGLIIK